MSLEGFVAGHKLVGKINDLDILTITAYGLAVKNGYKGTEQEWLASLKGDAYILTEDDKNEIAAEVGGMVSEHPGRKDNPHHVTAEQVGARPIDWMPTAEEVGARPNTWMPTAEEVGAATEKYVDDRVLIAQDLAKSGDVRLYLGSSGYTPGEGGNESRPPMGGVEELPSAEEVGF